MILFKLFVGFVVLVQPDSEPARKLTIRDADSLWARTYAINDTVSARALFIGLAP